MRKNGKLNKLFTQNNPGSPHDSGTCFDKWGGIASLGNQPLLIGSEVQAAEAVLIDGTYTYMFNEAGNPAPAIIIDGTTATIAMFRGTMIKLPCVAGVVPNTINDKFDCVRLGVPKTRDSVLVTAFATGTTSFGIKDTVTGATMTVNVNVLDPIPTIEPTITSTQVATTAYSYADAHKIVSADGMLELDLDNMMWSTRHIEIRSAPKIYYAEDGVLTIEMYQDMWLGITYKSNLDGYKVENTTGKKNIAGFGISYENAAKGTVTNKILTLRTGVSGAFTYNESTQLPIRLISIGRSEDGVGKRSTTYMGNIPMSFSYQTIE